MQRIRRKHLIYYLLGFLIIFSHMGMIAFASGGASPVEMVVMLGVEHSDFSFQLYDVTSSLNKFSKLGTESKAEYLRRYAGEVKKNNIDQSEWLLLSEKAPANYDGNVHLYMDGTEGYYMILHKKAEGATVTTSPIILPMPIYDGSGNQMNLIELYPKFEADTGEPVPPPVEPPPVDPPPVEPPPVVPPVVPPVNPIVEPRAPSPDVGVTPQTVRNLWTFIAPATGDEWSIFLLLLIWDIMIYTIIVLEVRRRKEDVEFVKEGG